MRIGSLSREEVFCLVKDNKFRRILSESQQDFLIKSF